MKRLGPYSRQPALTTIDMRSRAGLLLRETRAELTTHVGGKPSATQRVLIERAAMLTLRIAMMDGRAPGGGLSDHDAREYLAWTNALTRLMRQLGLKGAAERPPSLRDHIARHGEATS